MNHFTLKQGRQESSYLYAGAISFEEIAKLFSVYPFSEEVWEKADMQKETLQAGLHPVQLVLRTDPDCTVAKEGEELQFSFADMEITDGRSKAAAITKLAPAFLLNRHADVKIFTVSKEKMALLG